MTGIQLTTMAPRDHGLRAGALVLALLAGALGGLLAAPGSARALDLVVVEAAGAPFTPGDILPSGDIVTLEAGQSLTLIAPSGQIITLTGPHDGAAMPEETTRDADVLKSLKGLVEQRMADTSSLGVTRAVRVNLPDPWVIDVNSSGERCLREGDSVRLWRADSGTSLPLTLVAQQGAWVAKATWPEGRQVLAGPPELAPKNGDTLTVEFPSGSADVTFSVLPDSLPSEAARLAWLLAKGCDDQAAALAGTM